MNTAERFSHGTGPEPHSWLVGHDLTAVPPAPQWIAVPVRPLVPALSGLWIAADLKGCEPE